VGLIDEALPLPRRLNVGGTIVVLVAPGSSDSKLAALEESEEAGSSELEKGLLACLLISSLGAMFDRKLERQYGLMRSFGCGRSDLIYYC